MGYSWNVNVNGNVNGTVNDIIIYKRHEVKMSSPRNKWKPWDLAMFHMGKDGKVTEM